MSSASGGPGDRARPARRTGVAEDTETTPAAVAELEGHAVGAASGLPGPGGALGKAGTPSSLARKVQVDTRKVLVDIGGRFGLVPGLIVVIILFSFVTPTFLTVGNFSNIATSEAATLILAVAATVVLKAGDFDLSLSATMIIGAVALDLLMTDQHLSLAVALILTLLICAVIGLVNGFLVVALGLDSFVTTLATMTALTGIGYGLTNNQVLFQVPSVVLSGTRHSFIFSSLPIACVYGWILALVVGWILGRTPLGRRLAILGVSRETAALLGIRRVRMRVIAYVSAAVLAGFAGYMLLGVIGSVDPSSGSEYILTPFASAFLGTTIGRAGRFNVFGTILSLYFLSITEQGLVLAGAPSWIADVFNGAALAAALAFAKLWRDRRKRAVVGAAA
jgi:ribose transport system permease protein